MRWKTVYGVFILAVLLTAVIPASSIPTRGPYVDDPPPIEYEPGYGSPNTPGGLCTLCAMVSCGCAPAPPGYILFKLCDCTGSNCWNSCAYVESGE